MDVPEEHPKGAIPIQHAYFLTFSNTSKLGACEQRFQ